MVVVSSVKSKKAVVKKIKTPLRVAKAYIRRGRSMKKVMTKYTVNKMSSRIKILLGH
mgnify:CR=1 FL=1|jgi:hypothetical protein